MKSDTRYKSFCLLLGAIAIYIHLHTMIDALIYIRNDGTPETRAMARVNLGVDFSMIFAKLALVIIYFSSFCAFITLLAIAIKRRQMNLRRAGIVIPIAAISSPLGGHLLASYLFGSQMGLITPLVMMAPYLLGFFLCRNRRMI